MTKIFSRHLISKIWKTLSVLLTWKENPHPLFIFYIIVHCDYPLTLSLIPFVLLPSVTQHIHTLKSSLSLYRVLCITIHHGNLLWGEVINVYEKGRWAVCVPSAQTLWLCSELIRMESKRNSIFWPLHSCLCMAWSTWWHYFLEVEG